MLGTRDQHDSEVQHAHDAPSPAPPHFLADGTFWQWDDFLSGEDAGHGGADTAMAVT